MSVVVVGASGAVGGAVVDGLVETGVDVRATSRRPASLQVDRSVHTYAADFDDPSSFTEPLRGAERLFLYADLAEPDALLEMVAASSVRHVVLLSSSSVTAPGAATDFNASRFLRVERAVEQSGLAHTFLRPGGFASNAARWSWGIKASGAVPLPYPDAVQVPVHEADIADVAVIALTGDTLTGHSPILTGPERLTLRDQVAIISQVVGHDIAVVQQSEAQSTATLSPHVPDVWVRQIIKDWREAVGASPAISTAYTQITGKTSRTFRAWATDNVHLFR